MVVRFTPLGRYRRLQGYEETESDERSVLSDIVAKTPALARPQHTDLTWTADKNYYGATVESDVTDSDIELLRPARKRERPHPGEPFFKPLRQIIESVDETLARSTRSLGPRRAHHRGYLHLSGRADPRTHRRDLTTTPSA